MSIKLTRPLRICLLSYRSNPHCGGQGVYLKNLSRAIKDLGHSVDVVCGPPDPLLDKDIQTHHIPCLDLYNPKDPFRTPTLAELKNPINLVEWLGISTMGFPEPFTFGLRAYQFLKNRLHDYDILHDNQSLGYGVQLLGRFIPTVATIHHPITVDRDIDIKAVKPFWKKLKYLRWYSFIGMQKTVARSLLKIITVSKCARQDISHDFSIPAQRFSVVPNGINTRLFYRLPEISRQVGRIIVTTSADTPLKGLYYLLHAVAGITRTRDIRLVVIGTPKKEGGIIRLIRKLGIARYITFTGHISDMEFVREYAKATLAVVPSVYEGFGLPVGEAMACGVPVISTTGGALPEVVGNAGILVPPADAAALEKAIVNLLDHPDYAARLGMAGYKRVQTHFTWKKAAEKTIAVYQEAIRDYR
jgi:glycosyltransferase involved in cell wall biosynthesis